MTTDQPESALDEEIDDALRDLSEEDLTQVLLMVGQVFESIIPQEVVAGSWDEVTPEDVSRIALRTFMAGYLAGQQNEPQEASTDLLVGITPEDAATIVAGLLGDGATLTLSVIRQG